MPTLTIHTATYNRGYILSQAYKSLKDQTSKDFEWIITDDGSTDNTEELVKGWVRQDNGFDIIYNKLNHVGIPRALNSGVNMAHAEWFMMLDSDDFILPETVEKVLAWLDEIKDDESFAGIGFARVQPDGRFMEDKVPIVDNKTGYIDITHLQRKEYHMDMEMCEVHRTELFRKYPFQVWEDELYAPEQLNFFQIALEGKKLRWRLEKLYICEFLPDGQTKSNILVKRNPMGFAMMYNQNMIFTKSVLKKSYYAIQMIALCLYADHPEYLKQSNNKSLSRLLFPVGWALSIRRKRQFNNLD